MSGEYLPPVIAEFRADIADFIRKVEEVKLALDSIGSTSGRSFARVEGDSRGTTRELGNVRRELESGEASMRRFGDSSRRAAADSSHSFDAWMRQMKTLFPEVENLWRSALDDFRARNGEAADKMAGDFRTYFRDVIEKDAKRVFGNVITDADDAAKRTSESWDHMAAAFRQAWSDASRDGLLLAQEIEGEQRRLETDSARAEAALVNRRVDMWRGMFDDIEKAEKDFQRHMDSLEALVPGTAARYETAVTHFRAKMGEAADGMQADFDRAFLAIADKEAKSAFGKIIADAETAGDDAGNGFASRFARVIGDGNNGKGIFAGLAPGGARPNWAGLIAAGMPAIGPLAAGLAAPVVSGAVSALPGAAGSAGMLLFLKDAFGEVTKAARTLETQTNKYNTAADTTAQYLNSDAAAMSNYHQLLGQVTPQQAEALRLLTQQDVTWQSLSLSQQQGIIQLRETTGLYKALTPSQQNSINALLAEKGAWDALEPSQAAALTQYQNMHQAYDSLRTLSMPSMFGAIASAERAAADAMMPFAPVIQQAALGWKDLADSADTWFTSPDYSKFIQMWSDNTRSSIDSVGRGIGNVALGFIHIWEALSPMIGPSLSWINNFSAAFADWANTPKGAAELQHFMQDLQRNGPRTWQALGNIARTIGSVVSALAWNPITMNTLNNLSIWMRDVSRNDLGKLVIQFVAWGMAVKTLAQQFKVLAVAQALVKWTTAPVGGTAAAVGSTATAVGEGAAVGAASRVAAPAGMATTASGLIVPSAAATTGEAAAAGGAASFMGISSESRIVQLIRDDMEMSFIPALGGAAYALTAALAGVALAALHDAAIRIRDAQNGVVESVDGSFSAASHVAGTYVPQSFRVMANNIANSAQSAGVTVEKGGVYAASRFGQYTQDWDKHNTAMVDVMYLGRTQFGQAAAQFVNGMGGDVAKMGASLKQQGKSLNQAFSDSMDAAFYQLGGKTKASWADAEKNMTDGLDKFYSSQRQHTTDDYNALQKAIQQLTDDGYHHRYDREKQDEDAYQKAVQQYMTDKTNGLIDTSKGNINTLSRDLSQFMQDLSDYNSNAWGVDIQRLGRDTAQNFNDMTNSVDANTSHRYDQEIAQAQADIARIQSSIPLPFAHAAGGLITGPGTGTSDSIPAWLSNGEYVVNAKATSRFLPLLHSINNHFADGGFVDVAAPRAVNDQRGLAEQIALRQQMQIAQTASAAMGAGVSGSVAQWIAQGMAAAGVSGADWANGLGIIIRFESGGNPNAINLSDSNAAAGDPSRGLTQTIGSTFNAYHAPGTSWDIYDPIANIAASVRYIEAVYGSIDNVPGVRSVRAGGGYLPYDSGGMLPPGLTATLNGTGQPEAVLTQTQWSSLASLAAAGAQAVAGGVTVPIVIQLNGKAIYEEVRTVGWQRQRRNGRSVWNLS